MPIISQVGSRSWKVRFVFGTIYALLGLGALTMLYPLTLMLFGSVQSEADFNLRPSPLPEYLWDDTVLWPMYLSSKYGAIHTVDQAHKTSRGTWLRVVPPREIDLGLAEQFRAFREQGDWPAYWSILGHSTAGATLAKNARLFRKTVQRQYDGDIQAYSRDVGVRYNTWSQVVPPGGEAAARRFTFPDAANFRIQDRFKGDGPKPDWIIVDPDAVFIQSYLRSQWATIKSYNEAHGTDYADYSQLVLSTDPPADGPQRTDWETFVRSELNLAFVRIDPSVLPSVRRFLARRYFDKIAELNRVWGTSYASFENVTIPQNIAGARCQGDLNAFVRDAESCPLDALSVWGPRQAFERFLAHSSPASVQPVPIPTESIDWLDFQENKSSLRWEFFTRNYKAVLEYLLLHGNGIRNTIIFCALMIATNLLVNPLAAYALSRYKPPSMYTILLFCMATMAFPSEVTMIPSFLLLKRFPLYSLFVGAGAAVAATWVINRLVPRGPVLLKGVVGVGVGIFAGWWLAPMVANQLFGRPDATVSLLNTFWALVLPGMANGFSIFLLKGFFDSLPRELYEAAEIDGAGEFTKFWTITMSLSKPILAVMALGAFTAAYSEFMMALVIIPDQRMWTIMVWLFQMQSWSHPTVVYASLVVAAIPTLLIFVFCQNLIMRGIIVPSEK